MQQRIAYFVHNLVDPAVLRRVRMLHAGGARVVVLGFRRGSYVPAELDGAKTIDLGQTADAQFGQRILAVLKNVVAGKALRDATTDADVLMARNLEMLVLAAKLKGGRRLVYECLDIHRLLLKSSFFAGAIQWIERALLRHVDLIVTSSPRFEASYFRERRGLNTPVWLMENKVLSLDDHNGRNTMPMLPIAHDRPIVIGWFGMLRCRRTLEILGGLAARLSRRIEILIAGVPSKAEFPDFRAAVAAFPGITFMGPYRSEDLMALYSRIHFVWAIDYFEEGLNSAWLLPNRLYEALDNGVVPIALRKVETGRWLMDQGVGLVIDDPEADLPEFLENVSSVQYGRLSNAVSSLPRSLVRSTRSDCHELVGALAGADQK
jgi:glycosyltransferase involved in cell wall biosynthesis